MLEKKFSKKEALRFGWQIMKQNLGFFIPLLIVVGLITIFLPSVIIPLAEKEEIAAFVIDISSLILTWIVLLGLIKISLNFCDNLKSKITDIFSQYRLFFRYQFASILYLLIVIPGFILLIIPGIYLAIRFQFYSYFIVDRKSKIVESLKRSWAITQGNVWNLFLFDLLLLMINLPGFVMFWFGLVGTVGSILASISLGFSFMIGWIIIFFIMSLIGLSSFFVTIPTTLVAVAFVYRKLLTQSETLEETK